MKIHHGTEFSAVVAGCPGAVHHSVSGEEARSRFQSARGGRATPRRFAAGVSSRGGVANHGSHRRRVVPAMYAGGVGAPPLAHAPSESRFIALGWSPGGPSAILVAAPAERARTPPAESVRRRDVLALHPNPTTGRRQRRRALRISARTDGSWAFLSRPPTGGVSLFWLNADRQRQLGSNLTMVLPGPRRPAASWYRRLGVVTNVQHMDPELWFNPKVIGQITDMLTVAGRPGGCCAFLPAGTDTPRRVFAWDGKHVAYAGQEPVGTRSAGTWPDSRQGRIRGRSFRQDPGLERNHESGCTARWRHGILIHARDRRPIDRSRDERVGAPRRHDISGPPPPEAHLKAPASTSRSTSWRRSLHRPTLLVRVGLRAGRRPVRGPWLWGVRTSEAGHRAVSPRESIDSRPVAPRAATGGPANRSRDGRQVRERQPCEAARIRDRRGRRARRSATSG
jgi:hypothetical protein